MILYPMNTILSVNMSSYMMMPKDYARELMRLGQRDKASAFMEYVFDFDEKINNSLRFYATSWGVGKSTASRWIEDFRNKIAEHFDFWTVQNELKYRGTSVGQSRDTPRDTKKPTNTGLKEDERDTPRDTFGTVVGQRVNTKENNKSISGQNKFLPPTISEIKLHIETKHLSVDAEKFYYHYESNGWMVGKNKMKSWTSALMTWEKRENKAPQNVTKKETYGGLI